MSPAPNADFGEQEGQPNNNPPPAHQFVNGFGGWYIVQDPDGQQVIELVDTDDEEANGHPDQHHPEVLNAPGVGQVVADDNVPVNQDVNDAFWGIELGEEDQEDIDHVNVQDVGVQVDIKDQENTSNSDQDYSSLDDSASSHDEYAEEKDYMRESTKSRGKIMTCRRCGHSSMCGE